MKIKLCFSMFAIFILNLAFAAGDAVEPEEYKNMEQMLSALKLEKKQMEVIVDKLTESGRITPEDAVVAKREIASLKDQDLENIKNVAVIGVKKNNSNAP